MLAITSRTRLFMLMGCLVLLLIMSIADQRFCCFFFADYIEVPNWLVSLIVLGAFIPSLKNRTLGIIPMIVICAAISLAVIITGIRSGVDSVGIEVSFLQWMLAFLLMSAAIHALSDIDRVLWKEDPLATGYRTGAHH